MLPQVTPPLESCTTPATKWTFASVYSLVSFQVAERFCFERAFIAYIWTFTSMYSLMENKIVPPLRREAAAELADVRAFIGMHTLMFNQILLTGCAIIALVAGIWLLLLMDAAYVPI